MFFDLNVPVHHPQQSSAQNASKKSKGKQSQQTADVLVSYSSAQLAAIDARLDLLVHLGYTVIALNQTVQTAVVPKSHVNILDALVAQLKPRPGSRLAETADNHSRSGEREGTPANAAIFKPYDLISLVPTTQPTFSLACLTHSQPSALTAHIISLPLTLRLDFRMKHTLVRTALKNGAVFEISYVGALGGDHDPTLVDAGAAEGGAAAKRNWWATAKEVVRVTKGKGLLVSGGVVAEADYRAPRDVANLITLLGLPQEVSHSASTKIPKSLILRAQTRQTFRAVFSEPVLVVPQGTISEAGTTDGNQPSSSSPAKQAADVNTQKKRPREEDVEDTSRKKGNPGVPDALVEAMTRKKKRKKNGNQDTR
ncbi:hypothetical protein MSAN_02079200 [Mycena sanguinolenta]|uniref:PHP domain-like protein n=1 Tax=Mycena sanguinolenta TaxID=230812 RepID=A0A8H6XI52_9AGAR|nr:hypothetical protein MSAN_02079200 [Mycena sanguinolenta]